MNTHDLDARIAVVAARLDRERAPWRRFAYIAFGLVSVAAVFASPHYVWICAMACSLANHHARPVDALDEHLTDLLRVKQRDGGAS